MAILYNKPKNLNKPSSYDQPNSDQGTQLYSYSNSLSTMENADVTSSHYHTNDSGVINAGPYTGLTSSEARELNSLQREDYSKAKQSERGVNRENDIKDFQHKVSATQTNFANDYMAPAIKTAGSFSPMGPVIAGVDAYHGYTGNKGEQDYVSTTAELATNLLPGALKYTKNIGKLGTKFINKAGLFGKYKDKVNNIASGAVNKLNYTPQANTTINTTNSMMND